ncbi:substrate-binding domain-containing protein [Methylibium sp.]|uniref:substrate-binding domain-containing protein n=1 Tax=Methylibium sp. TaxID=2067992 RepID=UPI0033412E01
MQAPVFDRRRRAALGALAAALVGPVRAQRSPDRLITVGVEADLQASGLAARLRTAVARDTGLAIDWRPGPSGLLLPQLERGELDAALTQAPELELALERQNLVHDRRPIASSDFILVGPAPLKATKKLPARGDPAGIAGERDAAAALGRIVAAGERGETAFVTASEPSGARALEQKLWKAAGPQPVGPWLRTAGPGPTAVLALARETGGYAFVERGLWSALGAGSGLAVLVEGDPRLQVSYHVMRSFRVNHPGGKLLVNWLAGPNGRRVVAGFGRGYRRPA